MLELRDAPEGRGIFWRGEGLRGGVWQAAWGIGNDGPSELRPLAAATAGHIATLRKVAERRQGMADAGTLSRRGIAEKIKDAAREEIGPQWQRLSRQIERAGGYVKGEQVRLARPQVDKTDMAAAMVRGQVRQYFASLDHAERQGKLMQIEDPDTLAAILEAPAFLVGIDDQVMGHLRHRLIEASAPGKTEELETIREAVDAAKSLHTDTLVSLSTFIGSPSTEISEVMHLRPALN